MYQFLNKYGQLSAFGLGLLILGIYFTQVFLGLESFNALSQEDQLQTGIFNFGLASSMALTLLCVLIIAGFGGVYLMQNPKKAIRSILPFLIIAVLAVVLYFLSQPASSGPMLDLAVKFELTSSVEKFVTAGLWTTILLFFAAIASLAVMEIRNFFK